MDTDCQEIRYDDDVYYKACKDIVQLADVLGHSSIETTRIYLITTGAEHARRMDQLGLIS